MSSVSLATLSNPQLLLETTRLAAEERHATAQLIAHLAEVDRRELYLGEGYSSLFTYCTQALHLSEHAAYDRIRAARLAREFPLVLERLTTGAVTLATVALLAPHVSEDNCERLLDTARHQSKREVERLVAGLAPRPDVTPLLRRLPAARPIAATAPNAMPVTMAAGPAQAIALLPSEELPELTRFGGSSIPPSRATIAPLTPERYLIKVTVSRETHDKLRHAQDLLRHAVPTGDVATVLDRALTQLVAGLERRKIARVRLPRSFISAAANSRRVPANVRRVVWARDDGRCAFVGAQGRCTETAFLEFHHVVPWASGGITSVDNLALRCRAHNAYEGADCFGLARPGASPRARARQLVRPQTDRAGAAAGQQGGRPALE